MSPASPTVLVFDRDAPTREWYRTAFVSTDYRVVEAADGMEAVASLTRELPDLVITELRAHHRDGLALCVVKRSTAATADIPVLMVTIDPDPDTEATARFVGASVLLDKPPAPITILGVARRLILATPRAHVARRQLYRTLADLREEAEAQPPQSTDIEKQARELLTRTATARSSVMLASDEAKCLAVNAAACELTGYSEAELHVRFVWDLAPSDAFDYVRMLWRRFLVNGECAGDFLIVRKNGEEVAIQLCAQANVAPGLHATVVDKTPIDG